MKKRTLLPVLGLLLLSACGAEPAPTTASPSPPVVTTMAPAPVPTPMPLPEPTPFPSPSLWSGEVEDFTGEWHRTEVGAAFYGLFTIYDQTAEGFHFDAFANWYANSGTLQEETAQFTGPNRAVWTYTPEYAPNTMLRLTFLLTDGGLEIKQETNTWGMAVFGHNVSMDGTYTKGDPVYYYHDNVVEAIGAEALSALEAIMDPENYEEFLWVVREGQFYGWREIDEGGYRGLVFSGFYPGIGYSYAIYVGDDGAVLFSRNNGFYATTGETEPPAFLQ